MSSESIAEDIVEDLKMVNEEQEECSHDTVERDGNIWVCSECGLYFKPRDFEEENFLEWADRQNHINFSRQADED